MLTATLPLSDAIDPVERLPRKLRALVEEMPTHSLARQMSVREAMRHYVEAGDAGQAPVIFVDVRTLEETTVSTIPNAVQLNVHVKMNDLDLLATDMSFLASHFVPGTAADSNAAPLAKGPAKAAPKAAPAAKGKKEAAPVGPGKTTIPPAVRESVFTFCTPVCRSMACTLTTRHVRFLQAVVICYDSMGLRGGLAAIELEKFLNNGTAVYNLCGGIIQWYNEEGEVQHPVEKHAVQSLHPHQRLNTGFVKRHNEFKTDDLVKEQAEKDVKKRRKSRFSSTASVSSNNTRGGPKPAVAE
jgi:rhodanese-related sulfurtransferase